ncbi:hypothetical protein [Flammeovirga aprica]|uniref:Outer membrane protein beta-barrel domain-containing protein n=1 Tax=Flammeovirga aprica JL-4 TaxID=694437 RepID=A0A7X9RXC0_9BACT|nr:hypothetical protein [Flammeovirga aprica]NME70314.1 hypothetical protein [Flammeovirga aprica JL-4]
MIKKILILFSLVVISVSSYAQEKYNSFSFSVSRGVNMTNDNPFYGFSIDYSRAIKNTPFSTGVAMMWDEEKDKNRYLQNVTVAYMVGYKINDRWSIGSGIAKGFLNNENERQEYQFSDGDWSTGLAGTYVLKVTPKHAISITSSLEYNITQKEYCFSVDLNYILPW